MAELKVLGGDFAHDKRSSYFMGQFYVRPRGSSEFVVLGLSDAESLRIEPLGPSVAFFGAAGATTGATIGAAVAGPVGAVVGAILNGANDAHSAAIVARAERNRLSSRRFQVRFKDGRRLKGEIRAEADVLDRMQSLFDTRLTPTE